VAIEELVRGLPQAWSHPFQIPLREAALYLNEVLVVEGDFGHARAPSVAISLTGLV
jgi:hypothetical protein